MGFKIKIYTFYLFLLFVSSTNIYAFNSEICFGGTRVQYDFLAMTSSYFSSTGQCSMIGPSKKDLPRYFYINNHYKIKTDIAKGEGENLSALIKLLECNNFTETSLPSLLQSEFKTIFAKKHMPSKSYSEIYTIVGKDDKLTCKYIGNKKH